MSSATTAAPPGRIHRTLAAMAIDRIRTALAMLLRRSHRAGSEANAAATPRAGV